MTQVNNIYSFLDWWWCGLTGFSKSGPGRRKFIELKDGNIALTEVINERPTIIEASNRKLIDAHIRGSSCFLLAPKDKIINTPIPAPLKSASMETIAETLLPFKSEELYCTTDPDNTQIFAISKAESAPLLVTLESLGIPVTGIAFSSASHIHCSEFANHSRIPAGSNTVSRSIAVLAALAIIAALIGFAGWQSASRHQEQLQTELQQLKTKIEVGGTAANPTKLLQPEVLDFAVASQAPAERVLVVLRALLVTMPPGSVFSQIMFSPGEVVIDGQSPSASRVLASLEQSEVFANSKFVTAISSSSRDDIERFRLTTSIRSDFGEPPRE